MPFVPFDGKLDAAPTSPGSFVPFSGQLDAPVESKGLLDRAADAIASLLPTPQWKKDSDARAQGAANPTPAPTPNENRSALAANYDAAKRGTQKLYNLEGNDADVELNRMKVAGDNPYEVITKDPGLPQLTPQQYASAFPSSIADMPAEVLKGMGGSANKMGEFAGKLFAVPAIVADGIVSHATGKDSDDFRDWWFGHIVQPLVNNEKYFTPEQNALIPARMANSIGGLAQTLATVIASTPQALAMTPAALADLTATQILGTAAGHAARAAILPGLSDAASVMQDVYDKTGSLDKSANAGAATYLTTALAFMVPASAPGGAVSRAFSGAAGQAVSGEVGRHIMNTLLPDELQRPFSWGQVAESAAMGAGLGAGMGERSALPPISRVSDLGYFKPKPNPVGDAVSGAFDGKPVDPISDIQAQPTVDAAIAKMNEAVPDIPVPDIPVPKSIDVSAELRAIRPLAPAKAEDVSPESQAHEQMAAEISQHRESAIKAVQDQAQENAQPEPIVTQQGDNASTPPSTGESPVAQPGGTTAARAPLRTAEPETLMAAIKRLGGITPRQLTDIGIKGGAKDGGALRMQISNPRRHDLSAMAEYLEAEGVTFPSGQDKAQALEDMIHEAANATPGTKIYADPEAAQQYLHEQEVLSKSVSAGIETRRRPFSAVEQEYHGLIEKQKAAELNRSGEEYVASREKAGKVLNEDEIDRIADEVAESLHDKPLHEIYNAIAARLQEVRYERETQANQAANRQASSGSDGTRSPEADAGKGRDSGSEFELSSQTESEARTERDRIAAGEAQRLLDEHAADQRYRADVDRDGFSLAGSDRKADANPDQHDIFAQKAPEEMSADQLRDIARGDGDGSDEAKAELARRGLGYGPGNSDAVITSKLKQQTTREQRIDSLLGRGLYEMPESRRAEILKAARVRSVDAFEDMPVADRKKVIDDWLSANDKAEEPKGRPTSAEVAEQADLLNPSTAESPSEPITPKNELQARGQEARIADFGEKIGNARKDKAVPLGPRGSRIESNDERPAWEKKYVAMQSVRDGRWSIARKVPGGDGQVKTASSKMFPTKEAAEAAIPMFEVSRNHSVYSYTKDGQTEWGIYRKIGDRKRALVKGGFDSYESAMKDMAGNPSPIIEHKFAFPERPWLDKIDRIGPERRTGDVTTKMFQDTFGFRGGEFGNWNMGGDGQAALNHAYDALHDLADAIGVPPRALSLDGQLAIAFGARGTGGKNSAAAHYEPERAVINLTKIKGAGSAAHEWWHAADDYFAKDKSNSVVANGFGGKSEARPELVSAFKNLVDTIMKTDRTTTTEASTVQLRAQKRLDEAVSSLDYRVRDLRRAMEQPYNNKKPASAEQLGQFDALADKLKQGEQGDPIYVESASKLRGAMGFTIGANIREMNAVFKKVTGYSFMKTDPSSTGRQMEWMAKAITDNRARMESTGDETHTYKAGTDFHIEAKRIDGYRASDYWSTPEEMGARAFESYIFDKLTAGEKRSDYLVYGVENRYYAAHDMKPYPEGEERQRIDAAFDKLFDTIKTRETGTGVAMESRRDTTNIETATRRMGNFVDEFTSGRMRGTDEQLLGPTPHVLQALGAEPLQMHIDAGTIQKVLGGKHQHYITADMLKQLPQALYDPLAVFNSPSANAEPGKFILTELTSRTGEPVVVAVHLSKEALRAQVNDIASVYEWSNAANKLRKIAPDLEYYRNEQSLKPSTIFAALDWANMVQLARDSGARILTEADVVNRYGASYSRRAADNSPSVADKAHIDSIESVRDSFLNHFEGANALDIRVVKSRDDIPARFRPSPYADGVYHDDSGRVYLIGDNIPTPERAGQILLHEAVGHYGLATMMGEKFNPILGDVLRVAKSTEPLNHDPAPGDKNYATVEAVRRMYPEVSDSVMAQEVLARMAETGTGNKSLLNITLARVRQWLREFAQSMGFKKEFTLGDAHDLVTMASDYLRRGKNLGDEFEAQGLAFASHGRESRSATADERLQEARDAADLATDSLRDKSYSGAAHEAKLFLGPMAAGSDEARAVAKDYANRERLARWQWSKFDEVLEKNFTPDERKAMWEAADEENVMRQQGVTDPERGLSRLSPEQRNVMDTLHNYGEDLLQRARDTGMFQGEGLPYWTPRMAVMIGDDGEYSRPPSGIKGEGGGAQGRNITTTSANLKQRKYLTTEETEAAMKAKLGEGAQVVRDIRTMPMAMARLERAIAGRELVNAIKEIGNRTGEDVVSTSEGPGYFTLDHPAFKSYRPRMADVEVTPEELAQRNNFVRDGKVFKHVADPDSPSLSGVKELNSYRVDRDGKVFQSVPATDADGNPIIDRTPLYIRKDFEGPLKAIMSDKNSDTYNAMMALKSKTMGVIMYSPLIHNMVEFGRALPAAPGKVLTGIIYFEGNRAKNDPATMRQAIEDGLSPIGHRAGLQDVTGIMEEISPTPNKSFRQLLSEETAKEGRVGGTYNAVVKKIAERPTLEPGRSWTAKILAAPVGLVSKDAATWVKSGIDKAGNIWHNTLLWDRVGDLQMGLYVNIKASMLKKGLDEQTAGRLAAHMANRYAGALPNESMSAAGRKIANLVMFSRSFTIGNLGVMKDCLTGLPTDVKAQIKRDGGDLMLRAGAKAAQRKAIAAFVMDIGLLYIGNSLLQDMFDHFKRDKSWSDIEKGYSDRLQAAMKKVNEHPLESLLSPIDTAASLTTNSENEPGKEKRIRIGTQDDGTALYMRLPTGKIGEEFEGWMTSPIKTATAKEGTLLRPIAQTISNDKGFGRRVYDPDAKGALGMAKNVGRVLQNLLKQQVPMDAIKAGRDMAEGIGDDTDKAKLLGPLVGLTVSKGAPGGPAVGEMFDVDRRHQAQVGDIRDSVHHLVKQGKIDDAIELMDKSNMTQDEIRSTLNYLINPEARLNAARMKKFNQHSTDEDKSRMQQLLNQ